MPKFLKNVENPGFSGCEKKNVMCLNSKKAGSFVRVFFNVFNWFSSWWFQIFFIFIPNFGEDSHFESYFSDGLKPPTSFLYDHHFLIYSPKDGFLVVSFELLGSKIWRDSRFVPVFSQGFEVLLTRDTVDGRNPAPVDG